MMYFKGAGVARDYKAAVRSYARAALKRDAEAARNLGDMYHDGAGVLKDLIMAYAFYFFAIAIGDENAAGLVDSLEKKMTNAQVEEGRDMTSKIHAHIKTLAGN